MAPSITVATIGGVYVEALSKKNPTVFEDYWVGSGMGGQNIVNFSTDVAPINTSQPSGYTIMTVTKGILNDYFVATPATFQAFFAPGSYPLHKRRLCE